jgi:hypothetical protein
MDRKSRVSGLCLLAVNKGGRRSGACEDTLLLRNAMRSASWERGLGVIFGRPARATIVQKQAEMRREPLEGMIHVEKYSGLGKSVELLRDPVVPYLALIWVVACLVGTTITILAHTNARASGARIDNNHRDECVRRSRNRPPPCRWT